MASVFKREGRPSYYVAWTDHNGKRRHKSTKTTDKQTAQRIANKLDSDSALRRDNIIDGRLEAISLESSRPLSEILDAYSASLTASGRSQAYIDATRNKIESIADSRGWKKLQDISADGLNERCSVMKRDGSSARTIAGYIQSLRGLTRWAMKNGKLASDPIVTVVKPSSEADRKLVRRYLTQDEWFWLDRVTRQSPTRFGMTGQERALLYALAIQTGLRSAECRSLTRGSLFLTVAKPYVLANAANTKNRKQAKQYIQHQLAVELLNLVSKKLRSVPVFAMPHESTVVDMIREDMHRARGAWLDTIADPQAKQEAEEGDFLAVLDSEGKRIDFHALRHTCGTWLAQAGVDIKTVQSIMRHSTIVLTMDRYGHIYEGAEADAVAKISNVFALPLAGTGTAGEWTRNAQHSGCFEMPQDAPERNSSHRPPVTAANEKTRESLGKTKENAGLRLMRAERLELSTQSSYLLDLAKELQVVSQAIVHRELTEFAQVKELLLSHIGQAQASMSSQSRSQ